MELKITMAMEDFIPQASGDEKQVSNLHAEWMVDQCRTDKVDLAAMNSSGTAEKGSEKAFDLDKAVSSLEKNPNYGDITKAFPMIRVEIEKKFKDQNSITDAIYATDKMNRMEKLINNEFIKGQGDRRTTLRMSADLSRIWHKYAKQHPS